MKLVSWNIGNFIWAKHLPGRTHYSFYRGDTEAILELLNKEEADVIFLQEVLPGGDEEFLYGYFKNHPHHLTISTTDRLSVSLLISKFPIQEIHHTNSNDYVIEGITFFPIHLYAFAPDRRLTQTKNLLPDLPGKRGVIMGDTNFWILYDHFISKIDKKSYDLITEEHLDILKGLGPTCRVFLSLDKLFITKDLEYRNAKIVRHQIGQIDHYLISAVITAK